MTPAQHKDGRRPWLERFPLKALLAADVLPEGRLSAAFKEDRVEPVPRARQAELRALPATQASVEAFARELGVHLGIVVGQLQNLARVAYGHALTKLKARYTLKPGRG